MKRIVHVAATVEHPDHDEPVIHHVTASFEEEDVEASGMDLQRFLIALVQQLFAPIVVAVIDVLVEHWVR